MASVEETARLAANLSKAAVRRVESDLDVVVERSRNILDNLDVMRLMDVVWSARATAPDQHPAAAFRSYLIAAIWLSALIFFYLVYYVDISSPESSTILFLLVRFGQFLFLNVGLVCLLCCFEQGLDLVMGGLFLITVFWSAPPRKNSSADHRRQ